MGTSHLKSPAITALDAAPPLVPLTEGIYGMARLKEVDGYVTAVAADAALSTYQLCRVPTNAVLKSLVFGSDAQGAGQVQLGLYYSDSTVDGTPAAVQGTVVSGQVACFHAGINMAAAVASFEVLGPVFKGAQMQKRLWDAAGLSADPGGYFDIVATVNTTAVTTGTGEIRLRATVAE